MSRSWPFQAGDRVIGIKSAGSLKDHLLTVTRCQQSEGTGSIWRVYFVKTEGVEDDTWLDSRALKLAPPLPPPPEPTEFVEEFTMDDLEVIGNQRFGIF